MQFNHVQQYEIWPNCNVAVIDHQTHILCVYFVYCNLDNRYVQSKGYYNKNNC